MFCPNCGKPEQQENSYCRSCGDFLTLGNSKNKIAFGGNTPEEQIRTNNFLNLLTAVVSFAMAILLYAVHWGREDVNFSIYLAAAFLLSMGFWQTSTFIIGRKLKKNFKKRKENAAVENQNEKVLEAESTQVFLPEANLENNIPASITENTTRHLAEKINRKLP